MLTLFEQLAANLRIADALDAGVIALLMYGGLTWLRQRGSKSIAVGLVLVVVLFLTAHWLDMYLTLLLFRAGWTAVVLSLIVIFQQDIRRGFERLATYRPFHRAASSSPDSQTLDTLAELIANLAEHHTGALLVFEGREPLDHHVRGGVPVDGAVSLPLLQSIFHPLSPGHDGAVLVDGDRIDRLGVHLPLSSQLAKIGGGGTRHAAALGLAERCDATVVVVSEERGTISIAEHGELRLIEPAEVKTQLERSLRQRQPTSAGRTWRQRATQNLGLKLAAVGLACALWAAFAYRVDSIQRTFVVPIEYRNAEN